MNENERMRWLGIFLKVMSADRTWQIRCPFGSCSTSSGSQIDNPRSSALSPRSSAACRAFVRPMAREFGYADCGSGRLLCLT